MLNAGAHISFPPLTTNYYGTTLANPPNIGAY
jgi:hypothetical protein